MTPYAANLAASLEAGARLSPDEAARAVLPLAEAIAAEHAQGAVHGRTDPAYVAPEVIAGHRATSASDVWSVGALLFHAMAGHAPFEHSPETPARLRRAGWLGPVVEMALAESPAERPSMGELAAYLRAREAPRVLPQPGSVDLVTPPAPPVAPAAAPDARRESGRRRRTTLAVVVLGALMLTLALVAAILILGRHDRPSAQRAPGTTTPTHTASPRAARSSHPAQHRPRPERPSVEELAAFARKYVATASSDPAAGFRLLTPRYQQASPGYRSFWGTVRGARITSVHADRRAMTVTYTYRYSLPAAHGGRRERVETVTLDVVRQGKQLRIAGAR